MMIAGVGTQCEQDCPGELFILPVSLWMVGRSKRIKNTKPAANVQKEATRKLLPVVGNQLGWRTA